MVFFESKKTAGNKETGEAFFFRDSGAAIKGGRVSRLMFLAAVMHATVTKKRLRPMAIKARGGTEHQGGKGGGGKNRGGTRVDRGEKKTKQRKKKKNKERKPPRSRHCEPTRAAPPQRSQYRGWRTLWTEENETQREGRTEEIGKKKKKQRR
jgi:hypothetical protein